MDVLTDDQSFPQLLDHDITGFDNEALALDFDLDKLDELCLPEELSCTNPHIGGGNGFKINNIHLRGLAQPPVSQPPAMTQSSGQQIPTTMYCSQQQPHLPVSNGLHFMDNNQIIHTTLPDSPPDSEPYSPPDGHHNTHQGDSNRYTLTSTPSSMQSHMYPPHHRPPGLAQPPKTIVTMPGYHEPPVLNHLPPSHQPPPSITVPPNISPQAPGAMNPQILSPENLSPQNKKRKHMDSPNSGINGAIFNGRNGLIPTIKQEPTGTGGSAYTNYLPDCDDDYSTYDPTDSSNGYVDGVYQVIKWQPFSMNKWATLTDSNLKDLPAPQYRVDADKGFNFSVSDDSFVCQKKNHFQVTCHIGVSGDPKYVRTPEGVKKIDQYCIHFYGIKMESQSQVIKIEQSQSDRSKKPFKPVKVDLVPDQVSKMTVGRLHFSETTSNNMRKKGRPNPDQRYFMLVVSLEAHSGENSYMIAASVSEKIIVRASNPGQFESDIDVQHWQRGHTQDSVYHMGRVGVNTDHPDEAVTVHGNVKLTGHVLQTSDMRVKEDFQEIDSKEQLKKVAGMKIYNYKFSDDYADHVGLPEDRRKDTGVIAQEIQEVLPDAVHETGDLQLPNGKEVKNLLVVNKDRIFMENVGAVKELCKLTDNLEVRIDELEKMNSKLSKLKRFDSLKSTVSSKSTCSNSTISSVPKKSHHHSSTKSRPSPPPPRTNTWCSNRFIQITIIILICIMAFCLIAITILYILERQNEKHHSTTINNHFADSGGTPRPSTIAVSSNKTTVHVIVPAHTTVPTTTTKRPLGPVNIEENCPISQCERKCCGSQSDGTGYELTGYLAFQASMKAMKQQATNPPYHVITGNESGSGNQPSRQSRTTVNPDKIQVIINNNGQYQDRDLGKSQDNNNLPGGPYYYRKRRNADNSEYHAVISIPELNFTLSERNKDTSLSMLNNYTYNLPYSAYIGFDAYSLKFDVMTNHEVHKCYDEKAQHCVQAPNNEDWGNWHEVAYEWKIPFGKYKLSFFRFRVTFQGNVNVCSQPGEESDGSFTEYNLLFARNCTQI